MTFISRVDRSLGAKQEGLTIVHFCICMNTVEDTNTGFNSTGERAPIDGVGEQI
jgi:hypothetical protein